MDDLGVSYCCYLKAVIFFLKFCLSVGLFLFGVISLKTRIPKDKFPMQQTLSPAGSPRLQACEWSQPCAPSWTAAGEWGCAGGTLIPPGQSNDDGDDRVSQQSCEHQWPWIQPWKSLNSWVLNFWLLKIKKSVCLQTNASAAKSFFSFFFFFCFDDSVAPVNYLGLFPLRIKLKTMT